MPGDVKTRLIPHLSSLEAADLYKCFVSDTLSTIFQISTQSKLLIAYQPNSKMADLSWLGLKSTPDFFKQDGRSLGERLAHAFGIAFGRGSQHVVIIGCDSPTLPKLNIDQAFNALNDGDIVLGPSTNGGYYLIGLSRPCLNLFENVCWSTDQIFERTAQNAQAQGYRLRVLNQHYDVDTVDDLRNLHRDVMTTHAQAPATKKFLSALAKTKPELQDAPAV